MRVAIEGVISFLLVAGGAFAVIGAIGFVFERMVFGALERATVMRWGMVGTVKG